MNTPAWLVAIILAIMTIAPASAFVSFWYDGFFYAYHGAAGGTLINETPVPIAGAGIGILMLATGAASFAARRLRRNKKA